MKKNLVIPILLLFLSIVTGSCKKYLDINKNPNAADAPPIAGLLANTTNLTGYNVYYLSNYTSYYVQYLASPGVGSSTDTYQQVDPSTAWGSIYNVLTDLYDMRNLADEKGLSAYAGVADVLSAINLSMGTNVWGDMPYSEAFVGVSNLAPKFDDQKALYDTCLKPIDEGIATMQDPSSAGQLDAASDFIHGGDNTAWVKTAYAMKARMLNEVSKTSQYDPNAVLSSLANAYTSNGDDAEVTQFLIRNPWAQAAVNNAGLNLDAWLSSYFVDAANGNTYGVFDPRLPQITDTTLFHDYRGTPNGAGYQGTRNTDHAQCYLDVDKWYSSTNSPLQIITYPECLFIKAEASLRNNDMTTAYDAYLAGITAGMNKLNVPADSITNYLSKPEVAVGAANLTLSLIMKEKYVACFLMPVTWDDMRRFDYAYKDFSLPVNVSLSTFIRRMDYPSSESTRNGANVPNVSRTDHLWWDMP